MLSNRMVSSRMRRSRHTCLSCPTRCSLNCIGRSTFRVRSSGTQRSGRTAHYRKRSFRCNSFHRLCSRHGTHTYTRRAPSLYTSHADHTVQAHTRPFHCNESHWYPTRNRCCSRTRVRLDRYWYRSRVGRTVPVCRDSRCERCTSCHHHRIRLGSCT